MMRPRMMPLLILCALVGCKREPTFDERYDAANKTIVERARQIDAQIAPAPHPAAIASSSGSGAP